MICKKRGLGGLRGGVEEGVEEGVGGGVRKAEGELFEGKAAGPGGGGGDRGLGGITQGRWFEGKGGGASGGERGVWEGLPRDKQVEVEAAQLVDGVVGTEAGVAEEEEGEQLGGELQVGSAVQDDGED